MYYSCDSVGKEAGAVFGLFINFLIDASMVVLRSFDGCIKVI